jgi:hypothetical protein
MRHLLPMILLACTPGPINQPDAQAPDQPPCASKTGSTCHAAEVSAWAKCQHAEACGGLSHQVALDCQIKEMTQLCYHFGCSASLAYPADAWQLLDQCLIVHEQQPCSTTPSSCPL